MKTLVRRNNPMQTLNPNPMKTHTPETTARLGIFSSLLLLTTSAIAQTVTPGASTGPAAAGETIELSPFVVAAEKETGWVATETLAGSRLRTDFKDMPNQIETLTRDFLDDFALTNLDQAMSYTANVENLVDSPTPGALDDTRIPSKAARIRSIGLGTRTRNFFQVANPTDNFNLERVTVASGPNAILFGLGSPAGIFDSTPARALMRNKFGFELQFDSEDSKRAVFDANTVVVQDKLALRFMGLSKREHTFKEPNHDSDGRWYGAVTFTPFKNTSIILQGEKANRSWNRASRNPPSDFVSLWDIADQIAGSGHTTPRPVFNNSSLAGIATNLIFAQAPNAPVLIQDGSVPLQNWLQSVTVRSPASLPGVDPVFDAGGQRSVDARFFPLDANLFGTGQANVSAAYTKTIILEQRLARNLFLELAYNYENANNQTRSAGSSPNGASYNLQVDANQFIPGTTTPNPNLGRLFRQGGSVSSAGFDRHEDWRGTLSYELDLARVLSDRGSWAKWLGRHRFAGLYTVSDSESRNQGGFARRILDNPVITGVTLRAKTLQNWATHSTRVPQFRQYIDSPYGITAAGPLSGDWTLADANGKPFSLFLFDTPLVAGDGKRLGGGIPSGSLSRNRSGILTWQGFFLPDREKQDRLVLTYGYRRDKAKSATLDAASITQNFSGLYPVVWDTNFGDFGPEQTGINRSFGVVARPLKWLTAFYHQSSTFDFNIGRFDPFGEEIPGAAGDGKDYGVRFDLWSDKITLRVNRFENTIGPQVSGGADRGPGPLSTIDLRVLQLDPAAPTINILDGNMRGLPAAGLSNYRVAADSRSTGYEVELNLTPTRNWNIRVNGSDSKAVESDIGIPYLAWAAQRLPVWEGVVAKNGEVDGAGQPVTWKTAPLDPLLPAGQTLEQYYNSTILGNVFARFKAEEGTPTTSARSGRVNLITNYRFSEGRFKGWNVGGAARWLAAPVVGLGVTTLPTGERILDVNQQYLGDDELYFDAVLGYRGRMKAFDGFSYRLQLNVRNVLNERDPLPAQALTTGVISKISTVEPRLWVLTLAVEF